MIQRPQSHKIIVHFNTICQSVRLRLLLTRLSLPQEVIKQISLNFIHKWSAFKEAVNVGKYLLIESFHRVPTKNDDLRFFCGGSIWWLFFSRASWTFTVRILWRFNNNLFGKKLRFCCFVGARYLCRLLLRTRRKSLMHERIFRGSSSWIKWLYGISNLLSDFGRRQKNKEGGAVHYLRGWGTTMMN